MKKLKLLLLLLLPFLAIGQVATGNEQQFDYGLQNLAPQTITTPPYIGTLGMDGTMGQIPSAYIAKTATTININGVSQDLSTNRTYRTAQSDTGVLTFAGLAANSSTTINIGAVVGVVADNETTPTVPTYTAVNYAGATGVTVTTVGSGQASYVMLSSAGVISFQTTFPTSAERKAKIWLGKVSHPSGSVTLVINEPDYITSPLAFSRDLLQGLGGFINNGVYPIENGANLNMNVTGGTILGDGVNFVSSRTNPNLLSMGPNVAATFSERTRSGGVTTGVTSVNVGFYDVAGTVTAIPGGGNTSTIRYIFAIPGQGYIIQYGQNTYASLSAAIAAIGKETFVKWSNLDNNAILIGVLASTKSATSLRTQDGQAQFFQADRLGGLIGSTAGMSTATLQSAYNNSTQPQILTDATRLGVQIKRGSGADTDAIIQGLNGAGTVTSSIDGNGKTTATSFVKSGGISTDALLAGGSTLSNPVSGTGTANYVSKWSGTGTQIASQIFDNGTNVGVNIPIPTSKVQMEGNLALGGYLDASSIPNNSVLHRIIGHSTFGSGGSEALSSAEIKFLNGSDAWYKGQIAFFTNNSDSTSSLATERARITSGGNLLVGTTTDNGQGIVQVNGNITASPATLSNQVVIKSQSDLKADLISPALTGTPTAPTATAGTNTTQIATTAFVQSAMSSGTYTPVSVNISNVPTITPSVCIWSRVGNIITLNVRGSFTPTAAAASVFSLTLPVNRVSSTTRTVGSGSISDTGAYLSVFCTLTNTSTVNVYFKTTSTNSSQLFDATIIYDVTN